MRLWNKVSELLVTKFLRMGINAKIRVAQTDGTEAEIDLAELAAIDSIGAADLAKIDGITNGTVAAGKAAVVDANKDIGDFRNLDAVNLDAGASGTAGTVDVFPSTASKGKLQFAAADSAGDTTTTVTNASQAGARTYTIPDAGASASFAMTEGAQTINGVKTFGSTPVLPSTNMPLLKRSLTALSNANLQALAGTPIEVVAAEAGKIHVVVGWRFRLIFGTTAIDDAAADGNLILMYAGADTIDSMEADGLVDASATTQGISMNLTERISAESDLDNKAVQISNDGAEFTVVGGGDSTAEVEVFYYTLDTNPS